MTIQQTSPPSSTNGVHRPGTPMRTLPSAHRDEYSAPSRRAAGAKADHVATGLGWFSLGLGVAQLVAPGGVARLIGIRDDGGIRTLMRLLGAREVASGVGILARPKPAGWVGARAAGDAMDLALLGLAFTRKGSRPGRLALATASVAGVALLDLFDAVKLRRTQRREDRGMRVTKVITVNRPPDEVYAFWHDFQNLPTFMDHLESVQITGDRRSHWKAKGPAGTTVEWDAEITEDRPNERIAWRSVGGTIDTSGSVRFVPAPGGRGTEVRVEMEYTPPAGALGAAVAKLFGEEPNQQVQADLRAFKQVMETGEVVRSDASIHARPHPAQPPEQAPTPAPMHAPTRAREDAR